MRRLIQNKPFVTIKASEWKRMPKRTKLALAKLAKHLSTLKPEDFDRIKKL